MTRFNTRSINRAIRELGGSEILVRGDGYWYFAEGMASNWPAASVYTMRLHDLTKEQWIELYKQMHDNYELRR